MDGTRVWIYDSYVEHWNTKYPSSPITTNDLYFIDETASEATTSDLVTAVVELDQAIGAFALSSTLHNAYALGNTITTSAANGPVVVAGTEGLRINDNQSLIFGTDSDYRLAYIDAFNSMGFLRPDVIEAGEFGLSFVSAPGADLLVNGACTIFGFGAVPSGANGWGAAGPVMERLHWEGSGATNLAAGDLAWIRKTEVHGDAADVATSIITAHQYYVSNPGAATINCIDFTGPSDADAIITCDYESMVIDNTHVTGRVITRLGADAFTTGPLYQIQNNSNAPIFTAIPLAANAFLTATGPGTTDAHVSMSGITSGTGTVGYSLNVGMLTTTEGLVEPKVNTNVSSDAAGANMTVGGGDAEGDSGDDEYDGGNLTCKGGDGSDCVVSGTGDGGAGGNNIVEAGAGGAADGAATTSGDGGSTYVRAGDAGATANGAASGDYGILYLGTSNTASIEIADAGIYTKVKGALTVEGDTVQIDGNDAVLALGGTAPGTPNSVLRLQDTGNTTELYHARANSGTSQNVHIGAANSHADPNSDAYVLINAVAVNGDAEVDVQAELITLGVLASDPDLIMNGQHQVSRQATAVDLTAATFLGRRITSVTNVGAGRAIEISTAVINKNGWVGTFKDETGGAAANNITISTEGAETIDGAATVVIGVNYGSVTLYSNGSNLFTM